MKDKRDGLTMITVRVDTQKYELFKRKCKSEDTNMTWVIRGWINDYIKKSDDNVTVTDTMDVDLTRRVERLEAKEGKSWIRRKLGI